MSSKSSVRAVDAFNAAPPSANAHGAANGKAKAIRGAAKTARDGDVPHSHQSTAFSPSAASVPLRKKNRAENPSATPTAAAHHPSAPTTTANKNRRGGKDIGIDVPTPASLPITPKGAAPASAPTDVPHHATSSFSTASATSSSAALPPVPVTLLSGFLGAGKTTLLERILHNTDGIRCAVIVNDMAEVNIDASLLKGTKLLQTKEQVVELQNGCICCTLRKDLLLALREIANANLNGDANNSGTTSSPSSFSPAAATDGNDNRPFDVIVIESTGISEPMQVAETFYIDPQDGEGPLYSYGDRREGDDEEGDDSADNAGAATNVHHDNTFKAGTRRRGVRLDNCVTVVDCSTFYDYLNSVEGVAAMERRTREKEAAALGFVNAAAADDDEEEEEEEEEEEDDDKNISHLLIDQVEFANVIILNKIDLVPSKATVQRTVDLLRLLNPTATIIPTSRSNVKDCIRTMLFTNNFTEAFAQKTVGWMADVSMEGSDTTATATAAIADDTADVAPSSASSVVAAVGFGDHHLALKQSAASKETPSAATTAATAVVKRKTDITNANHTPETVEYGISSFVYRRVGRAFHPSRLMDFMTRYFLLEENGVEANEDGEEEVEEDEECEDDANDGDEGDCDEEEDEEDDEAFAQQRAAQIKAIHDSRIGKLGNMFRSKGYVWVGSVDRYGSFGEWNHAGNILRFGYSGQWDAFPVLAGSANQPSNTKDADDKASVSTSVTGMETLFHAKTPSQELVFIGQSLKRKAIEALLDDCLLTEEEQRVLDAKAFSSSGNAVAVCGNSNASIPLFEDPFLKWPVMVATEVGV